MYTYRPTKRRRFNLRALILLAISLLIAGGVAAVARSDLKASMIEPPTTKPTAKSTANVAKASQTESVCIDPGHGGIDLGANIGNLTERDINLIVAKQTQSVLTAKGYTVYMTRTDNTTSLSKEDRYSFCNSHKTTIMISIHHNFFSDKTVDYSTALYDKNSDQSLAATILASTSSELGLHNQGIVQFNDRVIGLATMPATISEAFFMTDSQEYNAILQPDSPRLKTEAQAIADGIVNYFKDPHAALPLTNVNSLIINY